MVTTNDMVDPGGFPMKFHWRLLGTPAPVFPGFEINITDRVADADKPDAVWHRERARGMLQNHPEIRGLFGHVPSTAFWCVACSSALLALAVVSQFLPWWGLLLVAYVFGAWLNLCLFQLAHECNHGLVFNNKRWDRWLFTLTTLPMMMPGHHTWWIEHHAHHNDMGAKKDFVKRRRSIFLAMKDKIAGMTVPKRYRWMVSWITTPLFWPIAMVMLVTQIGRAIVGLIVYAFALVFRWRLEPGDFALKVLADEHLVSGYDRYRIRIWAVAYPLLQLVLLVALFLIGGWKPLVFLLISALFLTGFLHPLAFGLILANSHFHGHRAYQPSSSYYGWLNWVTFNFGLHTEHHDLAAVPWNRLGSLRKIAPEYYDDLLKTPSYARLALQFAFGSREDFDNEEFRNAEIFADEESKLEPV